MGAAIRALWIVPVALAGAAALVLLVLGAPATLAGRGALWIQHGRR